MQTNVAWAYPGSHGKDGTEIEAMKVNRMDVTGLGDMVVFAEDFDRVEAERDALQALLNERDAELDRLRVRETGDWSWANVEWPVLEAIAREAAADHEGQHSYLEGAKSTTWQPHRWVLAAMTRAVDFAVRRSPETERHHLKNAIDRGVSSGLIPVVNSVSPNSRYSAEQLEAARELREVLK